MPDLNTIQFTLQCFSTLVKAYDVLVYACFSESSSFSH